MRSRKKSQAALEYLVTYGWAILGALVALGALSYFGFMNPSNLLPDKCDFGKQLECADYQIKADGNVSLMLRNNFGKDIQITAVDVRNEGISLVPLPPFSIQAGKTYEVIIKLDKPKPRREKADLLITFTFNRDNFPGSPSHNVSGSLFAQVP